MNYFNAVLLPPDGLSQKIIQYTQNHFFEISDGYCLSNNVLPHITLCQFKTEGNASPDLICGFNGEINLVKPNVRKGVGRHEGFNWFEIIVGKTKILDTLQSQIYADLRAKKYEVTTKAGKDYYPHLTFCRTKKYDEKFEAMPLEFLGHKNGWRFQIGQSDANGQYLG